jgi:hypothetical protein
MTDRELLEAAAKAAGLDFNQQYFDADTGLIVWCAAEDKFESWDWNPLTEDGDAFRLAVKLGMRVRIQKFGRSIADNSESKGQKAEHHCCDPCAATRRAIVRAAASIGDAL